MEGERGGRRRREIKLDGGEREGVRRRELEKRWRARVKGEKEKEREKGRGGGGRRDSKYKVTSDLPVG